MTRIGPAHVGEATLLLALSPFTLLPEFFPPPAVWIALLLLGLPALQRRRSTGRWSAPTPLNGPVAVLLFLFVPVGMMSSPFPEVSFIRASALAWSVAAFFCVVNFPDNFLQSKGETAGKGDAVLFLLLVIAGVAAILALFGIRTEAKLLIAGAIAEYLPNLLGPRLGLPAGANPNELAGVLVLFAPPAAALCVGALHTAHGKNATAGLKTATVCFLSALFFTAIVLTQSRDGLMASGFAVFLVFVLLGRRGLLPAGIAIILLFAALLAAGAGRVADSLLFAGKHTGLTLDSVLTFRIVIWERALLVLRDVMPAGIGFGAFGRVLSEAYPIALSHEAVDIADAHNLYLQTALDFGVAGFVVFAVMIGAALRMAARAVRRRGLFEYWSVGMLAGLAGFLFFNLFDAVSLGSRAGVALWIFLGMLCRLAPHTGPERMNVERRRRRIAVTLALVAALGVLLFLAPVREALRVQRATTMAVCSLTASPEQQRDARALILTAVKRSPRLGWLQGLVCEHLGDEAGRDSAWATLLGTNPEYIPLLRLRATHARALAERAVALHATSAEARFWLAGMLADTDTAEAIELYREGLRFDADDGLSWCRLGNLLATTAPREAIAAYGESCVHGDPGANGCLLAGRTAERIGDIPLAIQWYRRSRYSVALERAGELERTRRDTPAQRGTPHRDTAGSTIPGRMKNAEH